MNRPVRGFVLEILAQNHRMQHLALRARGRVTIARDQRSSGDPVLMRHPTTRPDGHRPWYSLLSSPIVTDNAAMASIAIVSRGAAGVAVALAILIIASSARAADLTIADF